MKSLDILGIFSENTVTIKLNKLILNIVHCISPIKKSALELIFNHEFTNS